MDRKSKILLSILIVLIIWSVWATYNRIFIKLDYLTSVEVPCDPFSKICFVYEPEEEGTDPTYYNIVEKPAYSLPICNTDDAECLESITCFDGETNCKITYCDIEEDPVAICDEFDENSISTPE